MAPEGSNHRVRPAVVVITVMGTAITIGLAVLIAASLSAHSKAADAASDVLRHDGGAESHPLIQSEVESSYEKIQIQQQAIVSNVQEIKDDVEDIDKKLDRIVDHLDDG